MVLKLRSVNNIVIAPAKTGNDNKSKKAVIKIDQVNRGNLCNGKLFDLIFNTVQIKFMAPSIDAAPERCKLKIAKSIAPPEWAIAQR